MVGVGRRRAVFQNIVPPGIIVRCNAHVVGNDVQNQAHSVFVKHSGKRLEFLVIGRQLDERARRGPRQPLGRERPLDARQREWGCGFMSLDYLYLT